MKKNVGNGFMKDSPVQYEHRKHKAFHCYVKSHH